MSTKTTTINQYSLHRWDYSLEDLFSFEERDISKYMLYDMSLPEKFKEAFEYIARILPPQKPKSDLGEMKWSKGKNYDWIHLTKGTVELLIRGYRTHFTIFFKNKNKENNYDSKYGCFSFFANREKLNTDEYIENNFIELNDTIGNIIEIISEGNQHCMWNPCSLKRPKHVEVMNIWNGGTDDLPSINDFIFCCEELFNKYLELFAENDMFEKIKTLEVGQVLNNNYKVVKIHKTLKDGYYHGVGLTFKRIDDRSGDEFKDVYSLTRWYLKDIFSK